MKVNNRKKEGMRGEVTKWKKKNIRGKLKGKEWKREELKKKRKGKKVKEKNLVSNDEVWRERKNERGRKKWRKGIKECQGMHKERE